MLELTKYSKQELETLKKAISEEQGRRESEKFPYKVGDCFVNNFNGSYSICRINAIKTRNVDITVVYCYNNELYCYQTAYIYSRFIKDWNQRIDPKIFDVYTDVTSTISALKQHFISKIEELCLKEK